MAIAIPALIDTQLTAFRTSMQPKQDSVTKTESFVVAPGVLGNRAADLLDILANLVDVTGLVTTGTHVAADAANGVSSPTATNQATADTMADEMKGDYNAHRVVTPAVHGAADATNVVTALGSDGSEARLVLLANDIRVQVLAHMARVTTATHGVADPNVVTVAACTDTATAVTLMNHLKLIYNAHIANINGVSATGVADLGAYTGVNALVGAKVTFTGNITTALTGKYAFVISNTTGVLYFAPGSLPASPRTGDTYSVEFAAIDKDLAALRGGKGLGDSASNPYGPGPSLINALMVMIAQLGGAVPSYLTAVAAQPFGIGSPHAANPSGRGSAAMILMAEAMLAARDTVAAYTKPT